MRAPEAWRAPATITGVHGAGCSQREWGRRWVPVDRLFQVPSEASPFRFLGPASGCSQLRTLHRLGSGLGGTQVPRRDPSRLCPLPAPLPAALAVGRELCSRYVSHPALPASCWCTLTPPWHPWPENRGARVLHLPNLLPLRQRNLGGRELRGRWVGSLSLRLLRPRPRVIRSPFPSQERPDGLGAAAGGARLSSLSQAAYGPAPQLCHTPAAAAAADFQPPYFPPPYPQPPLPYGQAPDAAAAFPHLAGDPYGGLTPLAQPQPPQAAWAAPRTAARAHDEPPGLLAPPARALSLDPRREYAAAVPRLLHSLADGAHGLAEAPLGLPGLAAPPGLEDLQVRLVGSGMAAHLPSLPLAAAI
ncbi:hypothetical protein GHT09_005424 [Marmota monax]|uniref:Uncharacterized protein n=1 Tax=Marmota monax TaxID=9995 RepID=A0A834UMX9_MARMO|nr:hypothetical protein GHT09_005424 [Marmota monax]